MNHSINHIDIEKGIKHAHNLRSAAAHHQLARIGGGIRHLLHRAPVPNTDQR